MNNELWWVWMIVAAAFVIAEIFTAGFFLLWFGIGAAAAGVIAMLGFSPAWQWIVFAVVSLVLFALSRRFADRLTKDQPSGIGADRLIGKIGVVLEEIDEAKGIGMVKAQQEEWRADSASGQVIPVGSRVSVVKVDGTHLIVELL